MKRGHSNRNGPKLFFTWYTAKSFFSQTTLEGEGCEFSFSTAMKRKGSLNEQADSKGTKRRKREKRSESDDKKNANKTQNELADLETKLDLTDPNTLLESILKPHSAEEFNSIFWEKKPLHIKREDTDYYGNLFSKESLMKMLVENNLYYEIDLNVCKFVDGEKKMLNGDDTASVKEIKNLFEKSGATIQFHQPQRFSDPLWKVMELMEKYFQNPVGANVYITPAGSQGLAPHNDDIEAFVLQLEGKKKWSLYKPLQELAREYSPDLTAEEIGEKTHEIELEPGDFLYFPRGTVHCAQASEGGHSTHITLSTYQNNSWGDLLQDGISHAIENALTNDVEFRRGLPLDHLLKFGTGKFVEEYLEIKEEAKKKSTENGNSENGNSEDKENKTPEDPPKKISDGYVERFKVKIKDLLCRIVDHVDPHPLIDSRSEDFMSIRLPPFEKLSDEEIGNQPTATSSIKMLYPDHVRLVVYDEDDDEDFDAEEAEVTDEEDIIAGEDEMDEDEDEESDEKGAKEEKPAKSPTKSPTKSKGKGAKDKAKGKNERKKGKASQSEEESETDQDDDTEDDDEEEDFLEGTHVRLLFSVHNARERHMVGALQEPNAVKLQPHFGNAMKYLLDHTNEFVDLNDLPLTDESDKLELATILWTEKLICVK